MSDTWAFPVEIESDPQGLSEHLGVLEDQSEVGLTSGKIVVECDLRNPTEAIEALKSPAAQDLALKYAQEKGVVSPRLNDLSLRPYPVDYDNKPLNSLTGHAFRYRVDVPIIGQV